LAIPLYALTPIGDYGRPTFSVDDRWRLYVNPGRLKEWTVLQVAGVLLHEVSHVIRDHAGRARTVAASGEFARHVWNVAADAEINDDLLAAGVILPHKPVTPRSIGMPPHKVAEFYYSGLLQAPPKLPDELDCGSGCHGQNRSEGTLPPLEPGLSGVEALLIRRRVAEEITTFASQQPGTISGGWERWAAATLRPQIDWRKLLAAKIRSSTAAIAGAADYSYSRLPRRRVPRVVLPSLRRPVPRIGIIVDTSGSVTDENLGTAWSEVHGCLRALGIRRDLLTVYAADVEVHRLTGALTKQVALTGGGGTDMAAAIESILAARVSPDLVVVITDGLTPWPQARPRQDVIVCLLPVPAALARHRPLPPHWASVVEIATPASLRLARTEWREQVGATGRARRQPRCSALSRRTPSAACANILGVHVDLRARRSTHGQKSRCGGSQIPGNCSRTGAVPVCRPEGAKRCDSLDTPSPTRPSRSPRRPPS
jgi:predicted metal-dependent peptidase